VREYDAWFGGHVCSFEEMSRRRIHGKAAPRSPASHERAIP
jgi:hypothetical protein